MRVNMPRTYMFMGARMVIHIPGDQTDNQVALIEGFIPTGTDSGLHVHLQEDESMYLISGELEVTVGNLQFTLTPGQSYFAPHNVPHRIRNNGPEEAQTLQLNVQGSFESFIHNTQILVPPCQEGTAVFTGKPPIYKRSTYKRESETYMFFGVPTVIHLAGIETGNEFSLVESYLQSGSDSGLHAHANEDECIYVLTGEVEVTIGENSFVLRQGHCCYVPHNAPHRVRNKKSRQARTMHLNTPGTLDPFIKLAGIHIKGPNQVMSKYPSPEQIGPILLLSEEYDFHMLIPPGM